MNRREQLAYTVGLIDYSSKESNSLKAAIEYAKSIGIEDSMHVGQTEEWFEEDRNIRIPEWLMGQFIAGHEEFDFLAYNSIINISMSFLNGTY